MDRQIENHKQVSELSQVMAELGTTAVRLGKTSNFCLLEAVRLWLAFHGRQNQYRPLGWLETAQQLALERRAGVSDILQQALDRLQDGLE